MFSKSNLAFAKGWEKSDAAARFLSDQKLALFIMGDSTKGVH
jgi:hypothetical protein